MNFSLTPKEDGIIFVFSVFFSWDSQSLPPCSVPTQRQVVVCKYLIPFHMQSLFPQEEAEGRKKRRRGGCFIQNILQSFEIRSYFRFLFRSSPKLVFIQNNLDFYLEPKLDFYLEPHISILVSKLKILYLILSRGSNSKAKSHFNKTFKLNIILRIFLT